MRIAALVCASLLLPLCAAAEPLPVKDMIIVDAHNVVVGYIQGFATPRFVTSEYELPVILLRDGARAARLLVTPSGLIGQDAVMFNLSDCAGSPYIHSAAPSTFLLVPNSAIFHDDVYQAHPDAAPISIRVRSIGDLDWCGNTDPTMMSGFAARKVMDLSGRWTPPLRIR